MKNCTLTQANQNTTQDPCIPSRTLKVIETGDFWAKRTMPYIHLQGEWLRKAGILPNNHVQITNPSPGILIIQLIDDGG